MMDQNKLNALQTMDPAKLLKLIREKKANTQKTLVVHNDYEQFFANLWSEFFLEKSFDTQTNFFELGGTSLQGVMMLSRVKDQYQLELDLGDIFKATTIESQAKLLEEALKFGMTQQHKLDYQQDIDAVNKLDFNHATAFEGQIKRIFLTGVTGFLGIHLLNELLKKQNIEVVCLVRAASVSEGKDRVLDIAKKYHIKFKSNEINRISCLCGDLEKEQLGLSKQDHANLAKDVDLIIHSGAMVNFVYPYEALREANVRSLYELMTIATSTKIKPIHFISSIGVFNSLFASPINAIDEDTPLTEELPLSGYFQTKWVCERMCQEARAKGLPIAIYRPSGITMNSQTKVTSPDDLTYALLKLIKNIKAFPEKAAIVDIVPVNYVAQSIVKLMLDYPGVSSNYHLTSGDQTLGLKALYGQFNSASNIDMVPFDEFVKRSLEFTKTTDDTTLKNIAPLISSKQFNMLSMAETPPVFENIKTSDLLGPSIHSDIKQSFLLLVRQ